jgi:hypothetical protein
MWNTSPLCTPVETQKNIPPLSISPPLVRRVSRGKQSAVQEADMASQHRPSEGLKSIVGGALVGLGLHILFGNLDRVAEQMKHMLGAAVWETLGVLPSAVLAASQAVQAYGLDHQGFLQSLLWMLISFWPLLLVIAGTVLLRNFFTEKANALPAPEKYLQNKDMGCRFHAFSFDV